MKVLLIKSERLLDTERWVVNPLGIMTLATVARAAGHEVRILDLRIERGEEVRRLLDEALDEGPDLVGLSALSHQATITCRVSEYVKRYLPDVFQVAGGPLANTDPDYLMRKAHIDACVLGEGELTFEEVLETISSGRRDLSGVSGLALIRNGELVRTSAREVIPDADQIPLPAWDLVDLNRYGRFVAMSMRLGKRASLQTSRGCPYGCSFCHNLFGKRFRGRSPEHVMNELQMLRRDYGVRFFELIDDIFNFKRERAVTILEAIRDRLPDCKISFPNGVRADRMDHDFVRLLARAHCTRLYIAIETATPHIQKETGKNIDIQQVRRVAGWLREEGIHTSCLFMVGFPGETAEEIEQTFALAAELPIDLAHISVVIPYKNTSLWEQHAQDHSVDTTNSDTIDPRYGYIGMDFSAVPSDELMHRNLTQARRMLLTNPRNWSILWAEVLCRSKRPVLLFYKLLSMITPRRWAKKLAFKSIPAQSFLETSSDLFEYDDRAASVVDNPRVEARSL